MRFFSFALLAVAAATAGAQETVRIPVAPESQLWIEGTSNLHGWSCKATTLDASVFVDSTATDLATAVPGALRRVEVKVPVKEIKCDHGGMDGRLQKALKADQDPEISYILASFTTSGETPNSFTLHATGRLTVAGVEKPIDFQVEAERQKDGSVVATGTVPILMTAYDVKPPTAMLGMLRTGDQVEVKFNLVIDGHAHAVAIHH
jgi:polyisoprenoid-binding protein YceI